MRFAQALLCVPMARSLNVGPHFAHRSPGKTLPAAVADAPSDSKKGVEWARIRRTLKLRSRDHNNRSCGISLQAGGDNTEPSSGAGLGRWDPLEWHDKRRRRCERRFPDLSICGCAPRARPTGPVAFVHSLRADNCSCGLTALSTRYRRAGNGRRRDSSRCWPYLGWSLLRDTRLWCVGPPAATVSTKRRKTSSRGTRGFRVHRSHLRNELLMEATIL